MDRKVDSRAMREVNRSIIFDLIRAGGRISRTELARRSSLTKPTVSTIVDDLLADGIVREVGFSPSEPTGGRRARLLEFNCDSAAYVGVRFGVQTMSVALADGLGNVVAERNGPAVLGDPRRALAAASEQLDALLAERGVPRTRVTSGCVALGGLIEAATGTCVLSTNLGFRDVPMAALAKEVLGVPCVVCNVTDAAAKAEHRLGIAAGVANFVWIYCGTGIGAGLFAGGQPFLGHSGFAGEIGFCRMEADGPILEDLASGRAILAAARGAEKADADASLGEVLERAARGETRAVAAVERAGAAVGLTVAHLVNIMNPELVVLGGGVAERSALFVEAARRAVSAQVLGPETVPVVPTTLAGHVVTRGAVLLALESAVQSSRIVTS